MGKKRNLVDEWREKQASGPDKWDRFGPGSDRIRVSWEWADPERLRAAIAAVVGEGSGILFGSTTDGGALVVQVLNGGGRHKLYPTDQGELDEALDLLISIALEVPGSPQS